MSQPRDAVAAATHPDPYPYYAELVARRPFYKDAALGLWVASSARAVTAVLMEPACRVRPSSEPVPRALLGSSAADVFRHLVRMNDGEGHCPMKGAVSAFLDAFDERRVLDETRRRARLLAGSGRLREWTFQLPVSVVGGLLGLPDDSLPHVARWTEDFVRGIAPGASPGQVERAGSAAARLLAVFRTALDGPLARLAGQVERFGPAGLEAVLANVVGFLSQTYDATAGLLGNAVVALSRQSSLLGATSAETLLPAFLDEVLRFDSPVQNTRRFLAADAVIEGQALRAGDVVLVVLAAANRDPEANADPERFDLHRQARRVFSFGVGAHACPGQALAKVIARGALEALLAAGLEVRDFTYLPSVNGRIPLFSESELQP
ncbi:cytochrome P450 [Pyxidicoccus xibeiensis]|uniref:cytochrome P450 n=1 Tax=Pyxidicoccus xibeiensis TaxID=2906759 RepID=UPI0020A7341B|nr:cytochrome P450 [Pyxidicoccus xibeiensis]MCP3141792.1 cytochrome P450 [Pyxidicoccus xibeiensis]